jgi:small subunit ribosomal protein S4e
MSIKGEKKKLKSLNAPRSVHINRKENTWTVKTRAGPHKKEDSLSIGVFLRDHLKLVDSLKEAKIVLRNGDVKINGVIRKDYAFGIGLFDVVSIEKQEKFFRIVFDNKRRIKFVELKEDDFEKISKVIFKKVTKKGIQITTNDGRVFIDNKAKIGDSLKIDLKENKITKVLEMKKDMFAYVTKGKHCSEMGKITEIIDGDIKRKKLIRIEEKGKKIETISENIIIVGEKNPEIKGL